MGLVEHDDMVQTLAADRTNDAFTIGVLPRRAGRNQHFLDAHVLGIKPRNSLTENGYGITDRHSPDSVENLICVCPNHHAMLDYGAIRLDASQLKCVPGHAIATKFIKYHNHQVLKKAADGRRN